MFSWFLFCLIGFFFGLWFYRVSLSSSAHAASRRTYRKVDVPELKTVQLNMLIRSTLNEWRIKLCTEVWVRQWHTQQISDHRNGRKSEAAWKQEGGWQSGLQMQVKQVKPLTLSVCCRHICASAWNIVRGVKGLNGAPCVWSPSLTCRGDTQLIGWSGLGLRLSLTL